MGQATLSEQLQNDLGSLEGDASVLLSMAAVLTVFSPGFEVLPGTLPQ